MEKKHFSIRQAADLCGVTERTLRYYDRMGLVCPKRTETNYRVYTEEDLLRLVEVLFYRELELPIGQIRDLMEADGRDRRQTLCKHRELLLLRREQIDRTLTLLNQTLEESDMKEETPITGMTYAEAKEQYRAEAEARWGQTAEYRAFAQKEAARTSQQDDAVMMAAGEIFAAFASLAAAGADPAAAEAQSLAKRWQDCITENWYPCTKQVLAGLGRMYICDERFQKNLDAYGAGTAQFMHDAIAAYCAQ